MNQSVQCTECQKDFERCFRCLVGKKKPADGDATQVWSPKYDNDLLPIGSMYGIYTYIYHTNQLNVGKYTYRSHGSYGLLTNQDLMVHGVCVPRVLSPPIFHVDTGDPFQIYWK